MIMNAVITGDLIHFTNIPEKEKVGLLDFIERALSTWSDDFDMEYEIYRGDSFQCYLNSPHYALRLALIIKTYIKSLNPLEEGHILRPTLGKRKMLFTLLGFDTRVSVGIGEKNYKNERLATSNGDAFILSGRNLDELKSTKQSIGISSSDNNDGELSSAIEMLDFILSRSTALQCEVVYLKLLGYNETEIANRLDINQSAVNQRSTSAGWNAIRTFVERFEKLYPLYDEPRIGSSA